MTKLAHFSVWGHTNDSSLDIVRRPWNLKKTRLKSLSDPYLGRNNCNTTKWPLSPLCPPWPLFALNLRQDEKTRQLRHRKKYGCMSCAASLCTTKNPIYFFNYVVYRPNIFCICFCFQKSKQNLSEKLLVVSVREILF